MILSKTSILFPRQSFHLHAKAQPSTNTNTLHVIALTSRDASTRWGICIQPKAIKRLFSKHPQTIVFFAGEKSPRGSETLGAEDLVVKILISENGVLGLEKKVQGVLRGVPDTEAWLSDAVAALQVERLVPVFDTAAFERMAKETLKSQQCHGSVAVEADYLEEVGMKVEGIGEGEVKETEKKSGFGFWCSKPHGSQKELRKLYSWEREDDPYGGLM